MKQHTTRPIKKKLVKKIAIKAKIVVPLAIFPDSLDPLRQKSELPSTLDFQ